MATSVFFVREAKLAQEPANCIRMRLNTGRNRQRSSQFWHGHVTVLINQFDQKGAMRIKLALARSYEPSQPQTAISAVQKLRLKLTNTAYLWRFGMTRFGVLTYWAEKLTRRAGLTSAHRSIKQRMDQIVVQHLK